MSLRSANFKSKTRLRKGMVALLWLLAAAIAVGHACLQYISVPSIGKSSRLHTDSHVNRVQGRASLGRIARPSAAVVYDDSKEDNAIWSGGQGVLMGGVSALGVIAVISNPVIAVASLAATAFAFARQRHDQEQIEEELEQQRQEDANAAPVTTVWDSTVGILRGGLAAVAMTGFYAFAVAMPLYAAGSSVLAAVVAFSVSSGAPDEYEERASSRDARQPTVIQVKSTRLEPSERRSSVTKAPARYTDEIQENAVYDFFHRLGDNQTYR